MKLLFDERVDRVAINDLNRGVAAFWSAAASAPDALCALVEEKPVTIETWHEARLRYTMPDSDEDQIGLAFATFFLNRTNRSGILHARPIGGLKQDGAWLIDARYNKKALINRIQRVGRFGGRIDVTCQDAFDFIGELPGKYGESVLAYVDPPYLGQGDGLYMNSLDFEDHRRLSQGLKDSPVKWLLTYDADGRVSGELYAGLRCLEFRISHTAAHQHVGVEWAVFARGLRVPDLDLLPTAEAEWIVA